MHHFDLSRTLRARLLAKPSDHTRDFAGTLASLDGLIARHGDVGRGLYGRAVVSRLDAAREIIDVDPPETFRDRLTDASEFEVNAFGDRLVAAETFARLMTNSECAETERALGAELCVAFDAIGTFNTAFCAAPPGAGRAGAA